MENNSDTQPSQQVDRPQAVAYAGMYGHKDTIAVAVAGASAAGQSPKPANATVR